MFLYYRKIILSFIIVVLHSHPYLQLAILSLLNIFLFFYSIKKPFDSKGMLIVNLLSEILMLLTNILISYFNYQNIYTIQKGRYIILTISFVLFIDILMIFIEAFKSLKESLLSKKKVTPEKKIEAPSSPSPEITQIKDLSQKNEEIE